MDKLKIGNNLLLKFQSIIFRSAKVINFYKQHLSDVEYKILKNKILASKSGGTYCFLIPSLHSYKILARNYLKDDEYKFSWMLSVFFILCGIIKFSGSTVKMLFIKPVFIKKQKSLVLKRLSWGFGGKGLKDDILIDNDKIQKKDMVYYYEPSATAKEERPRAVNARKNGYNVIALDKSFNINGCFYRFIFNNIICAGIFLVFAIIHSPFLLFSLKSFNSKTFQFFKLFSFVDVKYFWSIGNWHDIAETVVANNQGVRAFSYSWSDYAQSYLYPFNYTVQDDVFMWGPIEQKYMIHKSLHENMFVIGCLFSNNFLEKNKNKVFENLNLDPNKPVIIFYDSPVNNTMRFPQLLFDQFRKIILLVEKKYPKVQVVLKPKTVTDEYKEFFHNTSVKLIDTNDNFYLGDMINIATLNIGMGIVAPITISLIMNKPGIFFDTAGNYDSPFAKYERELVFRDQESLLTKIDQILKGESPSRTIDELKDYNIPGSNPVEILRQYVKTGRVDEKYRFY